MKYTHIGYQKVTKFTDTSDESMNILKLTTK